MNHVDIYWWWKPEYLEKTTELLQVQVTDRRHYIMLYQVTHSSTPRLSRIQIHNIIGDRH
jgi:hypothetical protein